MATESSPSDDFLRAMTEHQTQILGFITASLRDPARSQDVLQNTNLALWKKAQEYRPEERFLPWALGFARFEILVSLRNRGRDRLAFNTDLVELMFDPLSEEVEGIPDRQIALRHCLKELPQKQQQMLAMRYGNRVPLAEIASATGRSLDSVKSLLSRIRKALGSCINRRLALGDF